MVEFYIKFEKWKKCYNLITNTEFYELSAVLILLIIKLAFYFKPYLFNL